MRRDLSELIIISDRSGSMGAAQGEAQNAINRMLEDQKTGEGECRLTFVQFDDQHEVLYDGVNIKDVQPYKLIPRGWTALLDAVGTAINTVGDRLAKTPEDERPALVTVIVSTDGEENNSREYSHSQVAQMIKTQKEKYSWQFIFLGVELDEKIALSLNFSASNVANIKRCQSSNAYGMTSNKMSLARCATMEGASADVISDCLAYSDNEKDLLNKDV